MRGKLITLEGIDGSGKSTVLERLKAHPAMSRVVFTREPTTCWIGEAVEHAIHSDTDHLAELFLFTADHAEHISKVIQPALEDGKTMISDRYSDSRYAYQGVTLGDRFDDPIKWIQSIHSGWTIVPDKTILFDIDPKIAVGRCGNRGEQTKFEKIGFLERVRANYLRLAEEDPGRFMIVDTDRPIEKIEADVVELLTSVVQALY
ncbi:MAG TPA: dTMP kinase [Methanosarcinaceae archaeon]|nr:dTMP kinase [Methanosarcinaceae archaeon]